MKRWYVAKSKPQMVTWLTASLTSLGVETVYPTFLSSRRGKKRNEPLFPGYVFCKFDPENVDWPAIHWSPGLDYVLNSSDGPAHVPDELVEAIVVRAGCTREGALSIELDSSSLSDAQLEVLGVIFKSNTPPKQRIKILLHALGCAPQLTAPVANRNWTTPTTRMSMSRL